MGGNASGTIDGLAGPFTATANLVYYVTVDDAVVLLDPKSTPDERLIAGFFLLPTPGKFAKPFLKHADDVGGAGSAGRKIKAGNGANKQYSVNGNPEIRALRRPQFDEVIEKGFPDGIKLNKHVYNSLFKSGRKDIMVDDVIDALKTKPIPAKPGSVEYINTNTGTSVFVNPETKEVVGIWPNSFNK